MREAGDFGIFVPRIPGQINEPVANPIRHGFGAGYSGANGSAGTQPESRRDFLAMGNEILGYLNRRLRSKLRHTMRPLRLPGIQPAAPEVFKRFCDKSLRFQTIQYNDLSL